MNRIYTAFIALLATTLCACSAPPSASAPAAASPAASPTATVTAMNTAEMEKAILDHEKKMWELAKNKQGEEYKKFLAPAYRGVGDEGIKDRDKEVEGMLAGDIKEYALTDFHLTFPNPSTAVIAYKATQKGSYKGVDSSGTYYASAVWVKDGKDWKNLLYNQIKAAQPPKE